MSNQRRGIHISVIFCLRNVQWTEFYHWTENCHPWYKDAHKINNRFQENSEDSYEISVESWD